jgi:hypothetical protein
MKAIYTYTVIDEQTGETILDQVKNKEVEERIGIKRTQIPDYVRNKWLFQKRYMICKNDRANEESNREAKEHSWTAEERETMKEWDRVRRLINPEARKKEKSQVK